MNKLQRALIVTKSTLAIFAMAVLISIFSTKPQVCVFFSTAIVVGFSAHFVYKTLREIE